jgi:hypothetical protein
MRSTIITCFLVLLPVIAAADDVILKGGGKVSGRILSKTDTAVEVDVGAGVIKVPMTSVVRVDQKRSALDDYYERAQALGAGDAAGWLQLGKWASSQGLGTQARTAFENVIAIDPGNVEANQALGRVLMDGRWVSEEESYRARGYVQFEGEWMTPAEQQAILQQRSAEQQAEAARLDAERRAQEAEARAADAEARAREAEAAVPGNAGYPMYWGSYWGYGPTVWPTRPIATRGRGRMRGTSDPPRGDVPDLRNHRGYCRRPDRGRDRRASRGGARQRRAVAGGAHHPDDRASHRRTRA